MPGFLQDSYLEREGVPSRKARLYFRAPVLADQVRVYHRVDGYRDTRRETCSRSQVETSATWTAVKWGKRGSWTFIRLVVPNHGFHNGLVQSPQRQKVSADFSVCCSK